MEVAYVDQFQQNHTPVTQEPGAEGLMVFTEVTENIIALYLLMHNSCCDKKKHVFGYYPVSRDV